MKDNKSMNTPYVKLLLATALSGFFFLNGSEVMAQGKEMNPEMKAALDSGKVVLGQWTASTANQVRPYPGSVTFPGAVPPSAKRVKDFKFILDTDIPHWRAQQADWVSTGLYLPAGEVLQIELPADAIKIGLGIRIGCHTDNPDRRAKTFKRFPYGISKAWDLVQTKTTVASPFGGTVYLLVPKGTEAAKIKVLFSGAVKAPMFVSGQTSEKEWKENIRNYDAPWAELCSKSITLSVPSAAIRKLENPQALMDYWQKSMDLIQKLSGLKDIPAQRIVYDVQISAGFMHSGYPVMAGGRLEVMTDLEKMKSGSSWGFWHEIGHNQQWGGWTPSGQGETTNNLFALYVLDKMIGQKPALAKGWSIADVPFDKPFEPGAIGTKLNGKHGLSLSFWVQLINELGWEPIEKTIASYRTTEGAQNSKDPEMIWDNLLFRLSQNTGKDLGRFFTSWGAEVSPSGLENVKKLGLPEWKIAAMPGGKG